MNEPARPPPSPSSARPARRPATAIALVGALATMSCEKTPAASPPVAPITACPEGAVLEGAAPPAGLRQRCQKSVSERHGASREWYEDGRERTYSEWWQGRKHGRFKLWYKDGRVRSEGAHRHGAPAGPWKYYNEDGSVSEEQTFPTAPPPADWLTKAIAGQPPAAEELPAAPDSSPDPTADPDH
jgi:hypothetical protein